MGQKTLPQTSEKTREPTPHAANLHVHGKDPGRASCSGILKKTRHLIYIETLNRRHYDYGAAHQGTRAES